VTPLLLAGALSGWDRGVRGERERGMTSSAPVAGRGRLTFVYACDPEGNLLELQAWSRATDARSA